MIHRNVNNTTCLVYSCGIIVYPNTVVIEIQIGISKTSNVDDTVVFENAIISSINCCGLHIIIVFIGLTGFTGIEIVGSIITTRNHTVVFTNTARTTHN